MSLLEALSQVPDYRGARGKRHPLWVLLVVMVMGNLAGYRGNRPLGEFARLYGHQIAQLLGVELRWIPSYSTIRRAHLHLDFDALCEVFQQWMATQISPDEDCYAIDGKRICQPIVGEDGKTRFVGLVSVFAHHQGISVDMAALTEADNCELKVVQYLLEKLEFTGALLTFDALHAQKNIGISA